MELQTEIPAPNAWHSIVGGEITSLDRQILALESQQNPWITFTCEIGGQKVSHSMRVPEMIEHLTKVRDSYRLALDYPLV
ncbi:hypothetical protein [Teichococcus vastitatis]|uniref:Uncharacterized protein n=1 Tax=Teichococcus vastitatis TaxID=2307076 RepID=A0ABS9W822_9PROT|nr:hypothetical protein [Pseudoroseomonas vastitatis]MCI0755450.1 hypothetical protein [Pseudoroseomonas vastitatis]